MSTEISSIYDDILTELDTVLTGKTRIPNPYSLENNPMTFMRDSYGLRVDGAEATQRDFNVFSRFRNFTVVLSREILTTEVQTTPTDTAVKAMLEDIYTLQKEFLGGDQFGSATNIDIVNAGGFSGIEFFNFEKGNFISSEVTFSIMVSNAY
jgi:hypothetical protein